MHWLWHAPICYRRELTAGVSCPHPQDLLASAYRGRKGAVVTLLEKNGDPNETDNLGRTALIHAAAQGHEKVVEVLIEAGTDALYSPSTDGRTALHWAAFYGHRSVLPRCQPSLCPCKCSRAHPSWPVPHCLTGDLCSCVQQVLRPAAGSRLRRGRARRWRAFGAGIGGARRRGIPPVCGARLHDNRGNQQGFGRR